MQKVSVREATDRISELMNAASAGEEVVITRRGKPLARLVALDSDESAIAFPDHNGFRARQPAATYSSVALLRELRGERY